MKLVSYRSGSEVRLGALDGQRLVDLKRAAESAGKQLPGDMLGLIALGDAGLDVVDQVVAGSKGEVTEEVRLAAPLRPNKNVFCIGRNYKAHIEEGFRARGETPVYPEYLEVFTKPPTAIVGHEDDIRWDPGFTQQLDYEVEFALVIGTDGRDIPARQAYDHIYGYTIANDVSAREVQRNHGQWFKGKAMDTSCPLGPSIVPKRYFPNPQQARLMTRVNGDVRQDSSTADMLYDIPRIIEVVSAGLTLQAGDIIITGTPSGVGMGRNPPVWLKGGDVVECEIEGIGVLRNRVVEIGR